MKKMSLLLSMLLCAVFLLSACGPDAAGNTPEEPTAVEDSAAAADTAVEEEAPAVEEPASEEAPPQEASAADSKVGGSLVWVVNAEPDTLDPHKTHSAVSDAVMSLLGTSLVAMNPDGEIIPYVAESWNTSEDGLVWDFTLRQDVTFHDGTPLTAHDFAWTYQRAVDPETASPAAASMLGSMTSAEAIDDYTLRLTLSEAYYPFLLTLASSGYLQPLPQGALEEMGEEVFARAPVGTGPYTLKEWLTGERVVLERNPDYAWGPEIGASGNQYYIETIEFRVIPEYATQVAGLEAGEIDYMIVGDRDMGAFRDNPDYQVFKRPLQGISPYMVMNLEAEPFLDLNVRKAFNLALDREAMINVILEGRGVVQYGPISESVIGYWPGVEEIGYGYDPDQAAAYMEEAGYARNDDGMWEKDGEVLYIPLNISAGNESSARVAQIIQDQYRRFGVDVELVTLDAGIYSETVLGGEFTACLASWLYTDADLMYLIFHSSMIGALNVHRLNDPQIDALLEQTRTETDPVAHQAAVDEAQKLLVENAIFVPLYTPVENYVVSARVQDLIFSNQFGLFINDAYITE